MCTLRNAQLMASKCVLCERMHTHTAETVAPIPPDGEAPHSTTWVGVLSESAHGGGPGDGPGMGRGWAGDVPGMGRGWAGDGPGMALGWDGGGPAMGLCLSS